MSSAFTEATKPPNTTATVMLARIYFFIELLAELREEKTIRRPSGRLAELVFSKP
jgi:hypothetical protein